MRRDQVDAVPLLPDEGRPPVRDARRASGAADPERRRSHAGTWPATREAVGAGADLHPEIHAITPPPHGRDAGREVPAEGQAAAAHRAAATPGRSGGRVAAPTQPGLARGSVQALRADA